MSQATNEPEQRGKKGAQVPRPADDRGTKGQEGQTRPNRGRAGRPLPAEPNAQDGKDGKRQKGPILDTGQGGAIIWSSWIGTAVFCVAAALAAAVKGARLPVVIVDLGLFLGGAGVFLSALAVAAGRSREREIELWSLFLLEGVASRRVRKSLLGALVVEVVAALATAWITAALAFGCLVPMWALGHCGLWGARYGTFAPRTAPSGRRKRNPKG